MWTPWCCQQCDSCGQYVDNVFHLNNIQEGDNENQDPVSDVIFPSVEDSRVVNTSTVVFERRRVMAEEFLQN